MSVLSSRSDFLSNYALPLNRASGSFTASPEGCQRTSRAAHSSSHKLRQRIVHTVLPRKSALGIPCACPCGCAYPRYRTCTIRQQPPFAHKRPLPGLSQHHLVGQIHDTKPVEIDIEHGIFLSIELVKIFANFALLRPGFERSTDQVGNLSAMEAAE